MEEIKKELRNFIDSATVELSKYPLKEYHKWSSSMTIQEMAHIIFLHSSFVYARGFYALLKKEDAHDRTLIFFSGVLSEFGCRPIGVQFETFFINMMNAPESIFSKYKYEINDFFKEEQREHHWSVGDITGTYTHYKLKLLPDNLGVSEAKLLDFIRGKVYYLSIFRNHLKDGSYIDLFNNMNNDQVLLRRPLWVKCTDQQQFIESFSRNYPHFNITVWNLDTLIEHQQIPENGILFFIIPNNIPEDKIGLVINLLSESQELISKKTLLVVLDKQVIKYGIKIHSHEFLRAFDDYYYIMPLFKNHELHNVVYNNGEYKVDESRYFEYFWVDNEILHP